MDKKRICHLGAWGHNWGDQAIKYALQNAVGLEYDWADVDIQRRSLADHWAPERELLLIGGGGLLWDKPELKNVSGWQWDCSTRGISVISEPIIVHSIGLTRFPYGDTTGDKPEYWETLAALVEKAELFSVRNTMTQDHLREGLPKELGDKISVCPDPALFMPDEPKQQLPDGPPILGVCLAWDKTEWRWPGRYDGAAALTEFMDALSASLVKLVQKGWQLRPFRHIPGDHLTYDFCFDVAEEAGRPVKDVIPCHWWQDVRRDQEYIWRLLGQCLDLYSECTAVVSMRKHGLLIPAGLGVPVVGLGDMPEVTAICDQIGARVITSNGALFLDAILGASPIDPNTRTFLAASHATHIHAIQEVFNR